MCKKTSLVVLFVFAIILFRIPSADAADAEDRRISIALNFRGDKENNRFVPMVRVDTIMLSSGERSHEEYVFEELAFTPPQGFQIDGWGNAQQIDQDSKQKLYFSNRLDGQNRASATGIKYYSVYTQKVYADKVIDEWHTWDDDINETSRLYVFDYTTKQLKILRETKAHEVITNIKYSYVTDTITKEKYKSLDYVDYNTTGTRITGVYPSSDLYGVSDYKEKTTKLFSLLHNTYITTVPFSTNGDWVINSIDMSNNFRPTERTSYSGDFDLIIRKNGKAYGISADHSITEVQETELDWWQYQWRLIINNHTFGKRRINGWDYIISTDNNRVAKISERYTFVREVSVSPDRKYFAIVEAAYNKTKPDHPKENEQVRIYDINQQKVIRIVKLPYRDVYAGQVFWQSNTILQYRPFTSSNAPDYIRNINIDVLAGIVTKDQYYSDEEREDYILAVADTSNYFSLVEPFQIVYKGKSVVYTAQPSFEGVNGLVYCSIKDLARTLGAGISIGNKKLTLMLGGKKATVDLLAEDTITYNGTTYAPIKPIITKLGLQYKRENYYSTQILIE